MDNANNVLQPTQKIISPRPKLSPWIISTIIFAALSLALAIALISKTLSPISNPQSNIMPTISPAIVEVTLDDFPNKELLGENKNYSVYLINKVAGAMPETTGELIVFNKQTSVVTQMIGIYPIFGSTVVIGGNNDDYLLLSTGTGPNRTIHVLSLVTKTSPVEEFCSLGNIFLFYQDYLTYANCDSFDNRPWGAGEASSLVAVNLKTKALKTLLKSDLLRQYGLVKISGNILTYLQTSVIKEADWSDPAKQLTETKTLDLTKL